MKRARVYGDEEKAPPPVKRDVIGPEALRERLRLMAVGFLSMRVYREDVALTLKLLDELQVAQRGRTVAKALKRRTRGRRFEPAREEPVEGRVPKLLRLRPDVVEAVEAFAKSKGGGKPWGFCRAVNELLSAAVLSERTP